MGLPLLEKLAGARKVRGDTSIKRALGLPSPITDCVAYWPIGHSRHAIVAAFNPASERIRTIDGVHGAIAPSSPEECLAREPNTA